MTSGSITLNGITEGELITILQHREKSGDKFGFTPQTLQPAQVAPGKAGYNNAILTWGDAASFAIVYDLLTVLKK